MIRYVMTIDIPDDDLKEDLRRDPDFKIPYPQAPSCT